MNSRKGCEMVDHWLGTKLYFHKELRSSAMLFHNIMTIDENCLL